MIAVLELATNTVFTHWFHYYFAGGPLPQTVNVWYERAVWGNVFADLPLAVIAGGLFLWHHFAVRDLHRKVDELASKHEAHDRHLKAILDALDPDTDGGLADVQKQIAAVDDKLDPTTPGGLKVLLDEIHHAD